MTRKETLEAAQQIVCNDRNDQYGEPEDSFGVIASLWSAYVSARCVPRGVIVDILPGDVAMMMALLKIARVACGSDKEDNFVDLAGYAACGAEVMTGSQPDVAAGWVYVRNSSGQVVCAKCNKCGYTIYESSDETDTCPECHAKMRKADEK